MITIGKIATQVGMTADAVRYYEQEGLIQPSAKSGSGYRLYDTDAIRRLRFIRHAQQCGFTSLAATQSAPLVGTPNCSTLGASAV